VVREILRELNEDVAAMALRMAGTAGYVDMALMYGDMPIRYYQQGEWEGASDLSGVLMVEQYQKRIRACYRRYYQKLWIALMRKAAYPWGETDTHTGGRGTAERIRHVQAYHE
jgi:hypothetical protein